jgi:hypothetical protein
MDKVRARISEMPNRCKSVVDSSRRARYNNVEEEIEYFGVSLNKYMPVPSILTPTGVTGSYNSWRSAGAQCRPR